MPNSTTSKRQNAFVKGLFPDSTMIVASAGYFIMTLGSSAYEPYIGILLRDKGFNTSVIGWILGTAPFALLTLLPPVSYIADRYRCGSMIWGFCAGLTSLGFLIAASSLSHTMVGLGAILMLVAVTPNYAFFDEYTIALLGPDRRDEWGRARMWGSAGYGVGAVCTSHTVEWFGWTAAPIQYACCSFIAVVLMLSFPAQREHTDTHFKEVVAFTMKHPRLRLFLFCSCIAGVGFALVTSFLFIYLSDFLDAPKSIFGLCITLTVLIELPAFWFAPKLHQHVSDRQLFIISQVAWIVRACGYASIQSPYQVLPFESLHGVTYGFSSLAGTHFVTKVYPESLMNSALGMYHACFFGVGCLMGNIGGGFTYDLIGPRAMFFVWSAATAVMCIGYYLEDKKLEVDEPLAVDHLDSSSGECSSCSLEDGGLSESPRHSETDVDLPSSRHHGV